MRHKTTLLAAGLAGALGATSVALAADATIYGRVVSGIYHESSEGNTEASWDIGTLDAGSANRDVGGGDRLFSRIGVRATHELDNGLTSGLHIEKRLDGWRTRHQNVWLQGAFGRITLGQQSDAYYSAVSWDGSNFFGNWNLEGGLSRTTGVKYSTKLDGPFNFEAMISDDNSNPNAYPKNPDPNVYPRRPDQPRAPRTVGDPNYIPQDGSGDGVDRYELAASFAVADVATISVGYLGQDDGGADRLGGTVGGSFNTLTWKLGYQSVDDAANDAKYYGFHVGYGIGGGNLYLQYEDYNTDNDTGENDYLIFGYSYLVGNNTRIIAEHLRPDTGRKLTAVALRVDF